MMWYSNDKVILIQAKYMDDILIAVNVDKMKWISSTLNARFGLNKSTIDDTIFYNECKISQSKSGNISIAVKSYLEDIASTKVSQLRRKYFNSRASDEQLSACREMTGA